MQRPISPVSNYNRSGGVLLVNPTDRDLIKNYAIPNSVPGARPALGARSAAVIRSPIAPIFVGGTNPSTITFTSMTPATLAAGGPDTLVTFNGTGLGSDCVIIWNGSPEVTTFVSPTALTTTVKASLVSGAVVVNVALQKSGQLPTATRPFTFT
jgi:hypothetical protein